MSRVIAEEGLGHTRHAKVAYEVAYRQAEFRGRAAARIAQLQALQGDLSSSRAFLKDAVEAAPLDMRSMEQLEAATRALGDTTMADQIARKSLAMDPMSDFLKEETRSPDLPHLAADPYRVLRVAAEFMNLGLYQRVERAVTKLPRGACRSIRTGLGVAAESSSSSLVRRILQG